MGLENQNKVKKKKKIFSLNNLFVSTNNIFLYILITRYAPAWPSEILVLNSLHFFYYFIEESDDEDSRRRKRQMAEKAASGEIEDTEVNKYIQA